MEPTREKAIELFRQMWSDMKNELGDCPISNEREIFKDSWVMNHTPDSNVCNSCYLCEYIDRTGKHCDECPIDWGKNGWCMYSEADYRYSPISKILALPERKVK